MRISFRAGGVSRPGQHYLCASVPPWFIILSMDLALAEKIIIVTGAGKGIGAAIASTLAKEGALPALVDRDIESAKRQTEVIKALGGQALALQAELTETEECRKVVAYVLEQAGRIDGLVNNAGVNDGVGLESGDPERFAASLRKNLIHYFEMAHFALPQLKKTRGAIVNISSKVAETGQGNTSAYAAANGGRNALTREWAVELAKAGVRVNAVVVAECWTPMYENWLRGLDNPSQIKQRIESRIPLGQRMTSAEEIAAMVAFLLSPRSGHTTGQLIHVDGG